MKAYTTSDGKFSFKAKNTQAIVDAYFLQYAEFRNIISSLCFWIEGAYIVLEQGNVETFLQTFPHYKKHMVDYLKSKGFDVSPFALDEKAKDKKENKPC